MSKTNNIYAVENGLLQMVLELIFNLNADLCLFGLVMPICLALQS